MAYMWWALASALGDETAAEEMGALRKQMTQVDISKAQNLAAEWWEKHNN